jgi:hypothetical protein
MISEHKTLVLLFMGMMLMSLAESHQVVEHKASDQF